MSCPTRSVALETAAVNSDGGFVALRGKWAFAANQTRLTRLARKIDSGDETKLKAGWRQCPAQTKQTIPEPL
jgi:hypothetical protein